MSDEMSFRRLQAGNRQFEAKFPSQYFWWMGTLAALTIAGILAPLLWLDAPSSETKIWFLAPWALIFLAAGILLHKSAGGAFTRYKQWKGRRWDELQDEYINHKLELPVLPHGHAEPPRRLPNRPARPFPIVLEHLGEHRHRRTVGHRGGK